MIYPKGGQKGFTLLEMVMVLFFAAILVVVMFNLYQSHSVTYNYQQALTRVSTSGRATVETMQAYVAQANRILASGSLGGTLYTTSASTLVLQLPAVDASNNILAGKWDKAAFYPQGSNYYFRLEPDPSSSRSSLYKLLSDTLFSINLTYNTATASQASEVTVNIQNQLQIKNQTIKNSLQQNMYLHNF